MTVAARVQRRRLEPIIPWGAMVGAIVAVILFIPIRRYVLPGQLPFEVEPYRILVALVIAAWLSSMAINPHLNLRGTALDGPLGLFGVAVLGSMLVNPGRVNSVSAIAIKELTFLISFLLIYYMVASTINNPETIVNLVKLAVFGGAVVAVLTVIESRTNYNAFNNLSRIFPFLDLVEEQLPRQQERGARLRSYGSAQHPIALGAAFAILIPLSIYLIQRRLVWILATAALAVGALATASRTAVVMLIVVAIVFLWLRPKEVKRLWPALVPLLAVIHVLLPGTIGSLKNSFFPSGGLLQEQQTSAGSRGQGRIADLAPAFQELLSKPVLGQGYGTRVTDQDFQNAQILDNEWLNSTLELGMVGLIALVWLFGRSIRRLSRAAKRDRSERGLLFVALTASLYAFAVGMFTYDAFSFIQVTLILFLLLGFASVLLRTVDVDGFRLPSAPPSPGESRAARARGGPTIGGGRGEPPARMTQPT